MEILGDDEVILIWFIGMYVIFILQQITILYLVSRGGKNEHNTKNKSKQNNKIH